MKTSTSPWKPRKFLPIFSNADSFSRYLCLRSSHAPYRRPSNLIPTPKKFPSQEPDAQIGVPRANGLSRINHDSPLARNHVKSTPRPKNPIVFQMNQINHDPLLSDLRRQFEVPPYSQQVEVGSQVQMRCHPPKGRPSPSIYWRRNEVKIDPETDKNFMMTGEGHLIIVSAKMADMANYSCAAVNIASTRFSQPATLTVYGKQKYVNKQIKPKVKQMKQKWKFLLMFRSRNWRCSTK